MQKIINDPCSVNNENTAIIKNYFIKHSNKNN